MRGETIVCIATRRWDSLWRNTQQIMSRLARENRVLYFEPGRDPDRRHSAEMWRNLPNFTALRPRQALPNVTVIPTPSCLPYARRHLPRAALRVTTPLVAAINARILLRHVRRTMRLLDVRAPILWLYEPRHIDLVGRLGEKLVCYFNYDETADFAGNERVRDLLRAYDNRLSSRADLVFASSRGQAERRRALNANTHFIPNGVDFDLFHRALDPATEIAPEIARLPRPIIGLAGWLGYQIDAALLLRAAEAYPHCSLALVGPDCLGDDPVAERLRARPNVFMLGRQELSRLPAYLKAFDVALIPYRIGGHTLTVYPLKLHEYLAAGRAVVATALPELRPFADVVHIAETHEQFIAQIGAALHEQFIAQIAARTAVAQANDWDRRVETICAILRDHPKLHDQHVQPSSAWPLGGATRPVEL
jgi:glycosyltransferase involved in cell wall biosynthesis